MANIVNCAERERMDTLDLCVPCTHRMAAVFGRSDQYDSMTVREVREKYSCDVVRQIEHMQSQEAEKKSIIDNRVQHNTHHEERQQPLEELPDTTEPWREAVGRSSGVITPPIDDSSDGNEGQGDEPDPASGDDGASSEGDDS